MAYHQIKIQTKYLDEVLAGRKQFEIRYNDRDYRVGDIVTMTEFDPEKEIKKPRSFIGEIKYLTDFAQKPGWVVFSLWAA